MSENTKSEIEIKSIILSKKNFSRPLMSMFLTSKKLWTTLRIHIMSWFVFSSLMYGGEPLELIKTLELIYIIVWNKVHETNSQKNVGKQSKWLRCTDDIARQREKTTTPKHSKAKKKQN